MKLFINDELSIVSNWVPCKKNIASEVAYDFSDEIAVCKQYGVQYLVSTPTAHYTHFIILAQKITLDEFEMNHLFFDVLNWFDFKLEHAWLGGKGCDMALNISRK